MYGIFYAHKIFINMNLKSLIREEIDYFDWVKDVPGDFNIGDKFEYLPSTQSIYPYIVEVTNFVPSINGGIRGINVKVLDLGKNTKSTWDLNNEIYISKRHFSDYLMKPDFMGDLRLKKINESNDMEWIQNVNATPISMDEEWLLVNDIDPESIEEGIEIQKYLIDLGYSWGGPDNQELKNYCINAIYHFPDYSGGGKMLYHNGCREAEIRITNNDIENGSHDRLYYWSEIKPTPIREGINDLEWIDDVPGIEIGFCYSYFMSEPLVIERIRTKIELDGYPFSEYYDVQSIDELNPDEYEDTTIYSRNDETGYIGTIKLDMLIKNLTQGKLHPC